MVARSCPTAAGRVAIASPSPPTRSYRFPKAARLLSRADFERVQGSKHRATTKHFVFVVASSRPSATVPAPSALPSTRLGVVASKKSVGTAPQRNRAKRLLRELFRLHRDAFPEGVDVVVIARVGAAALTLDEVRAECLPLLRSARMRAVAADARAHVAG